MAKKKDIVKTYIDSAKEFLSKQYGTVRVEWESTLLILEDSLRRYLQVREELNRWGIYDSKTGRKNPLLSTEKDCVATILKLTQKLGISPWDASKIKAETEDDDEDFIKSLTE